MTASAAQTPTSSFTSPPRAPPATASVPLRSTLSSSVSVDNTYATGAAKYHRSSQGPISPTASSFRSDSASSISYSPQGPVSPSLPPPPPPSSTLSTVLTSAASPTAARTSFRTSHARLTTTMSELKLKKLLELNNRLKEQLDMPRLTVSDASQSLIKYVKTTKDFLVPSVWGTVDKKEDPYGPMGGPCPCTIA